VCGDRNWVYVYKRGDKRVKAHCRKLSGPQKQSMEVAMQKQVVKKKQRELAALVRRRDGSSERGDAEDALTHANAAAAAHDCKPSRLVRFAAHIVALCASSQDAAPPPLRATSPQSLQRDALAVTRDATLTVDDVDWCLQRVCAGCRGANSPSSHTLLAVFDELLALRFVTR
jgi:hypothetical protein